MGRSCASKPDFVYGRDLAHEAWRTRQGSFVAACASLVWPDILGDEPRRLAPLQPREAHIMGRSCASKPDFVHGRDLAHEAWRTRQGSFVAACASLVWPDILGDEPRRLAPLQPREAHIMGRSCASKPDFVHGRDLAHEAWRTRQGRRLDGIRGAPAGKRR